MDSKIRDWAKWSVPFQTAILHLAIAEDSFFQWELVEVRRDRAWLWHIWTAQELYVDTVVTKLKRNNLPLLFLWNKNAFMKKIRGRLDGGALGYGASPESPGGGGAPPPWETWDEGKKSYIPSSL